MSVWMARGLLVVATMWLGLVSFGCHGPDTGMPLSDDGRWLPPATGEGLVARRDSPIPDVPMPVGFVGVASRSQSSVVDDVRVVHHLYQGQAGVADAITFYRRELPAQGWRLISSQIEVQPAVLLYQKGREQLQISVVRRHRVVSITVSIQARPESRPAGSS